ncbi:MAG: monovalent cation/H(+) antiporter subunit G [Alphaproteobacteria bacterium]|nr:monovalent cation/H(+) antiporter subunit G [Alphaproteobacteria bacterium]
MTIDAGLIGAVLTGAGFLALAIGAVGLVRWPDVFTRLHAAHAAVVVGAPVALLGVAIASPTWTIAVKVVALGAVIAALAPTAVQIIGATAHNSGETARVGDGRETRGGPTS